MNSNNSCIHISKRLEEHFAINPSDPVPQEIDLHVAECKNCAALLGELQIFQKSLNRYERRSIDNSFTEKFWLDLEPQLAGQSEESSSARISDLRVFMKWSIRLAVAAVLLVTGIFIGRNYFTTSQQVAQNSDVRTRTVRYLERSKLLLLGFVNYDPEQVQSGAADFSVGSQLSRQLVIEAADLKDALHRENEEKLQELVQQLEMILMQIANLEKRYDLDEVEVIRNGITRQGVLFKIHLEELNTNTRPTSENKNIDRSDKHAL